MSESFLELVLPTEGTYCAVAIRDAGKGVAATDFVDSIEQLAELTASYDARGLGAFFALATFKDSTTRSADNALYLRSMFIDLDTGEGKPYADAADAAKALGIFIEQHKFPQPVVVTSGGGLHAYWPLTENVPADRWRPLAVIFKAFCIKNGLGIDPAVTSDAARVLRMPGTHNYKLATPRPVHVMTLGDGPVSFDVFRELLPAGAGVDLSAAKAYGADDTTRALAQGDRTPSKFVKIVQRSIKGAGCAQIAHAVTEAATLEEPLWRAALSIAWNCVDGETAIHKLSQGHPGYSHAETLAKAQKLTDKPYTCEWYGTSAPARCQGCMHKDHIKSPIQLGAFIAEAKSEGDEYVIEGFKPEGSDADVAPVSIRIPKYPYPYFRGENGGVWVKKRAETGEEAPIEVFPYDLYVTQRFYDSDAHGDGDGELVEINLHLPQDGVRTFHAPMTSLMAPDKLRDVIVKHGAVVYGPKLKDLMGYLAQSIRSLQSKFASSKTRSQMGWTPEMTFVVGDLEYTPSGIKIAPPASSTRDLAPNFHAKGSLEEWTDIINFYNRPGMEGHAFGFLVGLGSPLLKLLNNTQVRGAVLNLVSNSSGSGKTTVQLAINSIFGHPRELLMEAKDTKASRFHRLGTLNSICMTVDELTNALPEELSGLVYGSTSGRAPHRMEAQSNKLRTNNTTWCSVTVTSSNAVMADALAAHRTAVEGELKRVIDWHISTKTHIPKAETDAHFSRLATNYGLAGSVFMQHVVSNIDHITATLHKMQLKVDGEAQFQRNDRFYSAVCTIAFVAGMIGNKLGLFDFDLKRIYAYAIKELSEVRDANAVAVGDAKTMATEMLAKFINDNISNTLFIHSDKSMPGMPRGKLVMRYDQAEDELVVLAGDLRKYFVDQRVDFKASLNEFMSMGVLVTSGKSGELAVVRRIAAGAVGLMSAPSARCYVFKTKVLGVNIPEPVAAED